MFSSAKNAQMTGQKWTGSYELKFRSGPPGEKVVMWQGIEA
jgi:hypothetical protein